jgi:hypothetical protein
MYFVWFMIGAVLAFVYMWLQWMQIKNINPVSPVSQMGLVLSLLFRLTLFIVVTIFALQKSSVYGLIMFAGFWTVRSMLLILIGSGRASWFVRRSL